MYLARLLCRTDADWSFAEIGDIRPEPPHMVSSHQTKDPEYFAIPRNLPTIRYPDRAAIAPQMSPLLPCELLLQQSHLFLLCVVLTYNDSRIMPRKTCQIPKNSLSAPRTFVTSSGSPVKFLLHMAMIVSTVLPSLVPPRHIGDCSAIHFFTKNFVICSNQVTEIFSSGHDRAYPNPVPLLLAAPLEVHVTNWKCLHSSASGLTEALLKNLHQPIRQLMRYISLYFFRFPIFILVLRFL